MNSHTLTHRPQTHPPHPAPRQLWPADVSRLRLDHHPRIDGADAAALLVQAPGASYWLPETAEFLLVTPWRRRPELVTVHTFGAFGNEPLLLDAVFAQAEADGRAGLVLVDINEARQPQFYARHRFERLEEIVTYTHRFPSRLGAMYREPDLAFARVDFEEPALLRAVEELDHAAFPWFWWNSGSEFHAYLADPSVELWAGVLGGDVVAYIGITSYRRWGHLDRIATLPGLQGRGIGRAALSFSAGRLAELGARQMALSTQGRNQRSRTLYQQSGFQRTPRDDYAIHARVIDRARIHAPAGCDPARADP
jgi:ribosomal protein S18 acetylase RimI-like enzyme